MKGRFFRDLLQRGRINFRKNESMEDIETMYNIILNVRGKNYENANRFDEKLALVLLCKIPFPGKKPDYKRAIIKIKEQYRGISNNSQLQIDFKNIIRERIITAQSLSQIRFKRRGDVFKPLLSRYAASQ